MGTSFVGNRYEPRGRPHSGDIFERIGGTVVTATVEAGTATSAENLVRDISRELSHQFAGVLSATVIAGGVAAAIRDLRGSISGEALPEMASRLARVRLAEVARACMARRTL